MRPGTLPCTAALLLALSCPSWADEAKTGRVEIKAPEYKSFVLLEVPKDYTPKKAWPLLVALHGAGGNARNFIRLWANVAPKKGYIVAVPHGDQSVQGWKESQRTWGGNTPKYVKWMLEEVQKRYRINRERIYLSGFSAGGHVTFWVGLLYSDVFAALVPCSGCLSGRTPPEQLEKAKHMPVRALVGKKDPNYRGVVQSCEKLRSVGFKTVVLREFPNLAHQYPVDENPKVLAWFDKLYEEKLKAKGLTRWLEAGRKALKQKKYRETVEALRKITSLGLSAKVTEEAEALLAEIGKIGEERLARAKALVESKDHAPALDLLASIKDDFLGLPCCREAETLEKSLLADPAIRKKLRELEDAAKAVALEKKAGERLAAAETLLAKKVYERALLALEGLARDLPDTEAGRQALEKARALRANEKIMGEIRRGKNLKKCKSWYALAENFRKNGLRAEALKYYRKIAALLPDSDVGKKAQQRIRELG
jgi:predicted esterase